jgi:hypothetical protein
MFIAHLGLGLASKHIAPRAPLGVLLLASQIPDILCGILVGAGVEQMRFHPGITKVSPIELVYCPWSHGLLMSLVWSVLAGLLAARLYRERRTGWVVGGLVLSHWLLDGLSHIPDLPLFFGGSCLVGLGLWNYPAETMAVELGLYGAGLLLLLRGTRAGDRLGHWSLASLAVFFAGLFFLNHLAPPPPPDAPPRLLALPILIFIVLLPWGNWVERHRVARRPDPAAPG